MNHEIYFYIENEKWKNLKIILTMTGNCVANYKTET